MERAWDWPPGHELAPGLLAWAALGDGRRCQTWLAWDLERWAPVAVKLPRPGGDTGRAVAGLAGELAVVAGLAHPGVRRLLDNRLDAPLPHLVFEYVEGPTLDDALAEDGPFHPVDVVLVGVQLAAALGYLHGRGLVHMDVKPGNVVLRDQRPVLIDLGLAGPVGAPPEGGKARGSPPWMAPEQARRRPAAASMDLFAVGAVLYELATGEPAYDPADEGPAERRWPQLAGPPPRARSRNPNLPAALDEAVHALLAPDPADRPAGAREAIALLAGALPGDGPDADRPWPGWAGDRLAPAPATRPAQPADDHERDPGVAEVGQPLVVVAGVGDDEAAHLPAAPQLPVVGIREPGSLSATNGESR